MTKFLHAFGLNTETRRTAAVPQNVDRSAAASRDLRRQFENDLSYFQALQAK